MQDLLIIGAGPAGAAAAIEATRAGLDARCIDKAAFPRDKCCGDGLTAGALRHLEALGLDPGSIPSWSDVDDVTIVDPRGRPRRFPLPSGRGVFAAVARRRELDAELVAVARRTGAEIHEGVTLVSLAIDEDTAGPFVRAEVSDGDRTRTVHARHVIAADGMWSPTRKLLGERLPDYRGDWHAFRQYLTDVGPEAGSRLAVWFEPDLLPGYVWSFPLGDGSANVGFGIRRGGRVGIQEMASLWPDLLARPHIAGFLGESARPEAPHRAWPIPARLGDASLHRGPVLFVGDAATATDPMTGEGIGQAIETGRAAVEAIVTDPADAGAAYESTLRAGMVRDHVVASSLAAVLATERGARWSIATAGATAWTRRNFARWLFEDYPRAVLATPGRWHRGLFTADGAYASIR